MSQLIKVLEAVWHSELMQADKRGKGVSLLSNVPTKAVFNVLLSTSTLLTMTCYNSLASSLPSTSLVS
jgi:hypothetical protein